MIVVATEDFEVYHGVVETLRERDAEFTTLEPGDELPPGTDAVIVGGEDPRPEEPPIVVADPEDPGETVETALATVHGDNGHTVVGVDPGPNPGIAVLVGDRVIAAHHVPLADAVEVIREAVAEADDAVVRVGDGARHQGARVVNDLDDVRVELVDETATTPQLGTGASRLGDVLAAVNIARREGEPVEGREIEPTLGELGEIQKRSRERSAENRTIDRGLARRVAAGELTIEEALDEHASESEGDDGNQGE